MANERHGVFGNGISYAVGVCEQNGYKGMYVTIGGTERKTYIVTPDQATDAFILAQGPDHALWQSLASAVLAVGD